MLLKMLTLEAGLIRLAKDSYKEHLKLFRFELKQYLVFKMLRFSFKYAQEYTLEHPWVQALPKGLKCFNCVIKQLGTQVSKSYFKAFAALHEPLVRWLQEETQKPVLFFNEA